jgi:hypothetical protein
MGNIWQINLQVKLLCNLPYIQMNQSNQMLLQNEEYAWS